MIVLFIMVGASASEAAGRASVSARDAGIGRGWPLDPPGGELVSPLRNNSTSGSQLAEHRGL